MIERYAGLMSGTSADGIDAVVARFEDGRFAGVEHSRHQPHDPAFRRRLIALGRDAQASLSLAELVALDADLADRFAGAVLALLEQAGLPTHAIRAVGSHGQTVFHDPRGARGSLQLGDPNRIAAATGIPVVADFRRMDIALGGQGAPLVPAFHQAVFTHERRTAVLNLGGIANVSLLPGAANEPVLGFDCGPGNALMDEWAEKYLGTAYDADGVFAARGTVQPELLAGWLADEYFRQPPPKSTGRSLFNLAWAGQRKALGEFKPEDVQASFAELTTRAVAESLPATVERLLVCGGGARNGLLMRRLSALLPRVEVQTTSVAGLPPEWVEAAAFAWLAHQRVHGLPGNLPSVTGASRPAVLGGIFG